MIEPEMSNLRTLPPAALADYQRWLKAIKQKIHATRMKVAGVFSSKNLRYCRAFFRFYCDPAIWQQAVAKLEERPWAGTEAELSALLASIPWGHNIQIFTKCSSVTEARFYMEQTLEQGWSRDVLAMQLKSNLYARAGKAVSNFSRPLALPQSDLAQQTLKDPYTDDEVKVNYGKFGGFAGGGEGGHGWGGR